MRSCLLRLFSFSTVFTAKKQTRTLVCKKIKIDFPPADRCLESVEMNIALLQHSGSNPHLQPSKAITSDSLGLMFLKLCGFCILLSVLLAAQSVKAQVQVISAHALPGNQIRLVFTDSFGTRSYQVQTAPQIGNSPAWQAVTNATFSPRLGGGFEAVASAPAVGSGFFRIAVIGSPTDLDGDGLLNAIETQGWTVVYTDASGQIHQATVTSDPNIRDTDGDGLEDNIERQLNLNPRLFDTDGDGLTDFEEVRTYFTNPGAVDTDNDAAGDTRFLDGSEVLLRGTSPNLSDTDGDNRTDRNEFLQNGNSLVSDLPRPVIDIDENSVDLTLNVTYSGTTTTTKSYRQTLGQTQSSALRRSDATSSQTSYEASASITAGVEATVGLPPGVTVSASATVGFSAGFTEQNTVTVDRETSQEAQEQYEQYQEDASTLGTETSSGKIAIALRVRNGGTVAFTLKNLSITALKRNIAAPASPQPVGTLTVAGIGDGISISGGESSGVLNAELNGVSAALMKDLLRDPTQLAFVVGNFDLLDAESHNYAFLRDVNSHRTAGLTIDFGNGQVNGQAGRVDRYRVATNVRIDADGFPQGVALKDVLEKYLKAPPTDPAGVPYTLGTNSVTGKRVLTSVRGVATDASIRHFWVVAANRLAAITNVNFDEIRLFPGDQLTLFFATDEDNDRLTDREEFLYGTSDTSADTDGDGINDFVEVRTGWTVSVLNKPSRVVYSDPRAVDTDGDGLTDVQEKNMGTDPRLTDTDLDGFTDNVDVNPLVYTLVAPTITLTNLVVVQTNVTISFKGTGKPAVANVSINWGDGTANTVVYAVPSTNTLNATTNHSYAIGSNFTITATILDVNSQTASASTNVTTVAFPRAGLLGEYLFTSGSLLDTSGNNKTGVLNQGSPFSTPSLDQNGLNRAYRFDPFANNSDGTPASVVIGNGSANSGWAYTDSYTLSAWFKREDAGSSGVIVGQDVSPALLLTGSQLAFGIFGSPVGKDLPVRDPGTIPSHTWVHGAVTVSKVGSSVTFTLYKNGTQVAVTNRTDTTFTYPNTSRSRIGIYSFSNNNPSYQQNFVGTIDTVRVYNRALRSDEITALANDTN